MPANSPQLAIIAGRGFLLTLKLFKIMKEIFKTKIGLYALVLLTISISQSINGQYTHSDTASLELPEDVKHTYYKYSSSFVLENGKFSQTTGMVDFSIWAETDIIEGEDWITISNKDYIDQTTKKQITLLADGDSKITGKVIEGSLCTCYSLTSIYANGLSEKHPWLSYCERINDTPILYSSRLYASMVEQKWWQSKRKAKNEVWGEPYYNILGN